MTTISSTYEAALAACDTVADDAAAAAEAIMNPKQDDSSSLAKATLLQATDNLKAAVAALREGGNNKGPSDRTRNKLAELGL